MALRMGKRALPKDVLDFSRPRDFSDVVLMVEGEMFHVHRSILAMWSPVFSRMFTADFREKTAQVVPLPEKKWSEIKEMQLVTHTSSAKQIDGNNYDFLLYPGEEYLMKTAQEVVPLPGKRSSEIREMLLVIYPTSSKQIDGENYFFLLNLAEEYMMEKLTGKCEEFLMSCLRWPHQSPFLCLDLLDIAQDYRLERLETECIDKAQSISFRELKKHPIYSKINLPNFRKIVEGRIQRMEEEISSTGSKVAELLKKSKDVESRASNALNEFDKIVSFLVNVIRSRSKDPYQYFNNCSDTQEKLDIIGDWQTPFHPLEEPLSQLHDDLKVIQRYAKCS